MIEGAEEASGLLAVADDELLQEHGWEEAYWTVLDGAPVHKALVLLGRAGDTWTLARPSFAPETEIRDGEGLARHGEHVYVHGSHFGDDQEGLQLERAFAARFRERDLRGGGTATLEVWQDGFALLRHVNDALQGTPLRAISDSGKAVFITGAPSPVKDSDMPINIEGVAFREDGSLLLGLRCPASEAGHPLIVELGGYADAFGTELPAVTAVWQLDDVRDEEAVTVGIRDLESEGGGTFSLIAGGLDGEVLHEDDKKPKAGFAHWRGTLPAPGAGGTPRFERVRKLKSSDDEIEERFEGVARRPVADGYLYADDVDERVVLFLSQP